MAEPSLSIVIPAFNEEGRLPASLARISEYLTSQGKAYEVLVVDNGSADATSRVVKQAGERDPNIRLIVTPLRGKGRAVKIGVLEARGTHILFCDADLSTPIEEAARLVGSLEDGADVAIASREGHLARRIGEPYARHLMGRVFNAIVRLLAVRGIQDTQCGFKAFTRACAHDLFPCLTVAGWAFDVELLFLAQKRGYRIREDPVTWVYAASSRVDPFADTVRMFCEVLKVRWNDVRGVYG